ncbi:MAG: HEPN domain-containing protein [Nitrosomonadales bacterium]|nr:HEPN domain-containing protein [Nitrosomonadales bacterium]
MTPMLEEAQKLLRMAKADRDVFSYLKPAAHLRDAIVLFHAQQAIEKAIKAVLSARGIPFGRTHNLLALAALLAESGIVTPETPDEVAVLNPYAVLFRYDDEDIALVTRGEADRMVEVILVWADEFIKGQI